MWVGGRKRNPYESSEDHEKQVSFPNYLCKPHLLKPITSSSETWERKDTVRLSTASGILWV